VLFSNRSAAYHAAHKYNEALQDAERAVSLAPEWGKSYDRKGSALMALKRYQTALECFVHGASVEGESASFRLWWFSNCMELTTLSICYALSQIQWKSRKTWIPVCSADSSESLRPPELLPLLCYPLSPPYTRNLRIVCVRRLRLKRVRWT
jgi:hypothetical protein